MSNPPKTSPEQSSASPESQTAILRGAMLKSLSAAQRLIILLRYAEQMTATEIALAIDMTIDQVERHHDEAVRLLRKSVGLQAA
jgi:DNA-directed RNA polymerase specialized sigma24 family protein